MKHPYGRRMETGSTLVQDGAATGRSGRCRPKKAVPMPSRSHEKVGAMPACHQMDRPSTTQNPGEPLAGGPMLRCGVSPAREGRKQSWPAPARRPLLRCGAGGNLLNPTPARRFHDRVLRFHHSAVETDRSCGEAVGFWVQCLSGSTVHPLHTAGTRDGRPHAHGGLSMILGVGKGTSNMVPFSCSVPPPLFH
jgi:hypothetical protein